MINEKLKEKTVKSLICLAKDSRAADAVVEEYFRITETNDKIKKYVEKYNFVVKIFDLQNTEYDKFPENSGKNLDNICSDYFYLLSLIIYNQWD